MIYCGVDGGGTKTKLILSEDDKIIKTVTTTGSSIDTVSIEETKKVIELALEEIYNKFDLPKVDSIYVGVGGIISDEQIEKVNTVIKTIPYITDKTIVNSGNDMTNAYYSACSGRNNITLIIGTGSVAYGRDEENNEYRASGIGYTEGDFGSGYDMGKRGLSMMSRAFDGRIKHSELTIFLLKKFNIQSYADIVSFFQKNSNDRTFVASIAKIVVQFAEHNDKYALKIIDECTEEILNAIIAVNKKINLKNREIGVIGGLGNSQLYFKMLKSKIKKYDSRFNIHGAELSAEVASLEIAKKQMMY